MGRDMKTETSLGRKHECMAEWQEYGMRGTEWQEYMMMDYDMKTINDNKQNKHKQEQSQIMTVSRFLFRFYLIISSIYHYLSDHCLQHVLFLYCPVIVYIGSVHGYCY